MQGEDSKKRGERGQGAAASACGDHNAGPKSQSVCNLGNGGKVEDTWLVDKNKRNIYIIWLVISLLASTNF